MDETKVDTEQMGSDQKRALAKWKNNLALAKRQVNDLQAMAGCLAGMDTGNVYSLLPGDRETGRGLGSYMPEEARRLIQTAAGAVFTLSGMFEMARSYAEYRIGSIERCPPDEWNT